jgi:RNA polymerase sigma factor (sigma-70 family)
MSALFRARVVDFDRLYREHAPSVYRYAYAVLGNQPDAEDVTQQTFLNAYRAIDRGTKPRKAENWLLRIAHNEVRRHFRKNGDPIEVEFDDQVGDTSTEDTDPRLADVLRALRSLPPNQRAALVMREFEGRSYAEIATILEISQSALETLLFRARRGLAAELDDAFTCPEAEQALSRSLDGRLPRRESRRLKEHLHECVGCVRFATLQKRQRSLLKGLSVMPIPASLFLVRGEHAAAAGLGGAAAGSGAVAAGGAATGIAAKAAAVAASAVVAGGAGYGVATQVAPPREARPSAARAPVVPVEARPAPRLPFVRVVAPKPTPVASPKPRAAAKKLAKRPARALVVRKPRGVAKGQGHGAVAPRRQDKVAPGRAKPKPVRTERPETSRPQRGKRLGAAKRTQPKRTQERQRVKVKSSARPQHPDPVPPEPKKKP